MTCAKIVRRLTACMRCPRLAGGICVVALLAAAAMGGGARQADEGKVDERQADARLTFQTHAAWSPRTAIDADVAICYGHRRHAARSGWRPGGSTATARR